MTLDFAAIVPPSLAPACAAIDVGAVPSLTRACRLGETGRFDRALSAFAAAHDEPDRSALVSFWSMFYLAALIAPATAALLCRDRVMPVGFAEVGVAIGGGGLASFRLTSAGNPADVGGRRFDTLVDGHVAPFVALCAARAGLSPRVLWSNAAVTFAWVLDELRDVETMPAARAEAEALRDGCGGDHRLADPFRVGSNGVTTRRVCCLRYRLSGAASCGGLCPRSPAAELLEKADLDPDRSVRAGPLRGEGGGLAPTHASL